MLDRYGEYTWHMVLVIEMVAIYDRQEDPSRPRFGENRTRAGNQWEGMDNGCEIRMLMLQMLSTYTFCSSASSISGQSG
jgi:hypothetical protein